MFHIRISISIYLSIYLSIYIPYKQRNTYIYHRIYAMYILPQNSTIDLILRTVLPIFMQSEAFIYTALYKHKRHLLSTYAEVSEKLTFLTPLYAHVCLRIRG